MTKKRTLDTGLILFLVVFTGHYIAKKIKHVLRSRGYLVERWVRRGAAQIGCPFRFPGLPTPFLFTNWFNDRSHFGKMLFFMNFSFSLLTGCQNVLLNPNLRIG